MWSPSGPALSEMGCETVSRPLPQESSETTSSNCMGDVLLLDFASMSGFNTTPGSQEVSILLPPCSSHGCCPQRESAAAVDAAQGCKNRQITLSCRSIHYHPPPPLDTMTSIASTSNCTFTGIFDPTSRQTH